MIIRKFMKKIRCYTTSHNIPPLIVHLDYLIKKALIAFSAACWAWKPKVLEIDALFSGSGHQQITARPVQPLSRVVRGEAFRHGIPLFPLGGPVK